VSIAAPFGRLASRLGIGARAGAKERKGPPRATADRLDDWPNPVVVKELRQAVNGRFAAVVLIALLAVQITALSIGLLVGDEAITRRNFGREMFTALQGILFFASVLALPIYAGVRVMVERAGNHLDLLYATTLPPRLIVRGKVQAAALLAALLYAASLPLMSLCYLLRGIDLPSMAIVLGFTYLVVFNAIVVAVAVGCLPVGRVVRVLAGIALVFVLFVIASFVTTIAGSAIQSGVGARLARADAWRTVGVIVLLDLLALRLLFLVTVAMVAPPASNRALPVRRYLALVWAGTLALAVWGTHTIHEPWPVRVWGLVTVWAAVPLLLAACSGRDRPAAAVLRALPQARFRRGVTLLFTSGSAGGFAFAVVWLAATCVATALAVSRLPPGLAPELELAPRLVALSGYFLAYAAIAAALVRGPLRRFVPHHQAWAVAVTLAALASSLPPIAAFLFDPESFRLRSSFGLWLLPNPAAVFQAETELFAVPVGLAAGGLAIGLGLRWWRRVAKELRPQPPATTSQPQPTT
jgi:hypothetical protein